MKTRRRGVPGAGWALSWLVLLAAGMPLGLPSLTAAAAVTVVNAAKLPLAGMMGDVAAGAWQRVTIPLQAFADNPGNADLTRVKTIFFGQQTADGAPHQWYLDDIRMTGGDVVTGADVPLIVVLGSSTAAGAGTSLPDSSWVSRYRADLAGLDSTAVVVNLAVGGYTTYHIMPTGHIPPPGRPYPSAGHNITMALAYRPWAIIVNLPSNDVASGYSIAEQLANYETVKGLAEDARAPIWFTTAQPRNFASQAMRDALRAMTDSTFARYGDFAIDFWHGLAAADGTILPQYNSGDGIHLNNAGHRLLHERVVAAGVWECAVLTGIEEPAQGKNEPAPRRPRRSGTGATKPAARSPGARISAVCGRRRAAAPGAWCS